MERERAQAVLVVMGPAGAGKTTLGVALATALDVPFLEGDALHAPASIAKMRSGIALQDEDRWPWLQRIRSWIDARLAAREGGVVACSALRRSYREVLLRGHEDLVRLVFLDADRIQAGWRVEEAVAAVLSALAPAAANG